MDREVAISVSKKLHDCFQILEESILEVNKTCGEEEAKNYRQKVGAIFTAIVLDLLEPLYQEHRELKPKDWGDQLWSPDWLLL